MSEEGSREITTSEGNGSNEQATSTIVKEKRKRGRTLMGSINNLTPKLKIEFNDKGQMVGENSKKLASYMGVLAREHASLDFSSWTKVDSLTKNRLWEMVTVGAISYRCLECVCVFGFKFCF
ncbi:hypothetical protein Sjap_000696 [Stephania japonica]|uniref:Uncharacterized protein n=1 Tax=Stephania japonica TaxID=461633 RepID=A0AAP0KIL9_9MAGN